MFGKSVHQIGASLAKREGEIKRRAAADLARTVLASCGVPIGADFHALNSATVGLLASWMKAAKYRAPRNASGSPVRCYHAMLQRRAARS